MTRARDLADGADKDIAGTLTLDDIVLSNDMSVADNGKVQFGAGNDLQIYHDGSNSYITEGGDQTGDLFVRASNLKLTNASGDFFLWGRNADSVRLYHNNAQKLETTSSGIDVTGTVTADLLTVDGTGASSFTSTSTTPLQINGASIPTLRVNNTVGSVSTDVRATTTEGLIRTSTNHPLVLGTNQLERMRIDSSGNVGIGTTSPQSDLSVKVSASRQLDVIKDSGDDHLVLKSSAPDASYNLRSIELAGERVAFSTGASSGTSYTERMRIDSSGNVGIGTDSPDSKLTIANTTEWHDGLQIRRDSPSDQYLALGYDVGAAYIIAVDETPASAGDGQTTVFGYSSNGTSFTESMRIDSSGHVGINNTTPGSYLEGELVVGNSTKDQYINVVTGTGNAAGLCFQDQTGTSIVGGLRYTHSDDILSFWRGGGERMRLTGGILLVGKTDALLTTPGVRLESGGSNFVRNSGQVILVNRHQDDGSVIGIYQAGTQEGEISVSGSTVSFNGGHLSRWSQLTDGTEDTTIVKGTVMTNLDQMAVWSHDEVLWAADDDLPDGVSVGDVRTAAYTEDNEQLNCMAVSSVEGDANVAGVFVNWDNDDDDFNDMNIAMTGDMVIRIAQGTTVARGDLLMSAGDGTAKPQGDDIVRSKTIAKVTSTTVSHTYDDGSYLVPCVLMAC